MDDVIQRAKFLIHKIQSESFVLEENFNNRIREHGFNPIHVKSLEGILDQLKRLDGTEPCRDTEKYV